jgi:DNA polymerase IIIc chi subunit
MYKYETKVVFFSILETKQKINKIILTANFHNDRKEKVLFLSPDEKAVKYVDNLLWQYPDYSFLPHSANEDSPEYVIISSKENKSLFFPFIFNLTSKPYLPEDDVRIIYEFEDLSSVSKKELFDAKYRIYKEKGFLIESR